MEIEGTIVQEFPLQEGTSKAGNPWKKKEYLMEYPSGAYTNRVVFNLFNNQADNIHLEVGKRYAVSVDIRSREFNGRWYTDVSAYAARPLDVAAPQQAAPAAGFQPAPGMAPQQPAAPDPFAGAASDATDDLPF